MSTQMSRNVGQAKIEVSVKGCLHCGTEHSSGWRVVRFVPVSIGDSRTQVALSVCADCDKAHAPKEELVNEFVESLRPFTNQKTEDTL